MAPPRQEESELDRIADTYARIAAHAKALAALGRQITNHLEQSALFSVIVADTAIVENYCNPPDCLAWLAASHRSWLRTNEQFNRDVGRLIFYRYILLPYPSLIQNWQKRQLLTDIILLHLHLQLWYGVICGVVFLDPRQSDIARVLRDLNFVAIPSHHTFLDTPGFYRAENLQTSELSDANADASYRRVAKLLAPRKGRHPVWLHYDERNYSRMRLNGWRWDALRLFFRTLYGPRLFCIGCHHEIGTFELDHIAPIAKGYPQTLINFRPLCRECNRKKSDLLAEDPFQLRFLLPDDLRTRDLDDVLRLPPPWLGKLETPFASRDITRVIL